MRCPFCNCKVRVPDHKVGKSLNCPRCRLPFVAAAVTNANPLSVHAKRTTRDADPESTDELDLEQGGSKPANDSPTALDKLTGRSAALKRKTDTHPALGKKTDEHPALESLAGDPPTVPPPSVPEPAPGQPPVSRRRRWRRFWRKNGTRLGMAGQFVVLAICITTFFGLGFSIMKVFKHGAHLDHLAEIKTGMTLREVEALLGPGEVTSSFTLSPAQQNVEGISDTKEIKVVRWTGDAKGRLRTVSMCFENDRTRVGFQPVAPPALPDGQSPDPAVP